MYCSSTIFKTFNGNKGITSKIGILKKSFTDIGQAFKNAFNLSIEGIFDTKGITGDQGFFKNLKNQFTVQAKEISDLYSKLIVRQKDIQPFLKDTKAKDVLNKLQDYQTKVNTGEKTWDEYFSALGKGEEYKISFVQNTDLEKASIEDVMNAQKAGAAKAKAYNASLQEMTIGAKAANVAMKGLALAGNVIGSIAISVAIEKIAEGISGIANYEKNLASAAKSAGEAIKQTDSDIDSYKDKITELQEVLTDHSSTVEEVASAKQQLLDIQSELTEKYGSEASGIDLVNGSLERQLEITSTTLTVPLFTNFLAANTKQTNREPSTCSTDFSGVTRMTVWTLNFWFRWSSLFCIFHML